MAIAQPDLVTMGLTDWRIEPVGDRCLQIRLGDQVSVAVSQTVHAVTEWLLRQQWHGVRDVVPAFTTVAVHYRPEMFPRDKGSAFAQLSARIRDVLVDGVPAVVHAGRVVEVPACYGGEYGPDLEDVARACEIDTDEVIRLHSATPLVLYTFFFSPGNPFAGPLHPRLNVPRRSTPRTLVPAGSVAIANGISSIYQDASPGGTCSTSTASRQRACNSATSCASCLSRRPSSTPCWSHGHEYDARGTARHVVVAPGRGALRVPALRRTGQWCDGRVVAPAG